VLYLSANLWLGLQVGGSVGHTAGVANELTAAGHSVELASIAPPPLLDGRVRAVPLSPPATLGLPFEANSYRFSASIVRQLRPRLSHVGTGFIYQRLSVANYAGVVLSRQTGTPLVLEYNGSEAWTAMHWGTRLRYHELAVAAEDACLKHAHVVVTVSDVLRDELEKRGVEAERIACYPNGVDPERFDPTRVGPTDRRMLRSDLGIPSDAVVVGFIGTFGRWHGVDVLARAIRQMVTIDDEWLTANRVRFLLIGDGLLAADVDAILSAEPRCAQFVVRTGIVPQERAPALLAISDVVVSPHVPNPDGSRFFGSPTKLFEYMAAGKPIVASDLEQIGQVLTPSLRVGRLPPNEAGQDAVELAVLAKPADVNELVLGIRFLVEHPGWRQMLGENARFQVRRQYTWSHHVAAILERLRMVVPPQLALSARR
jgi:glycosyltransferase involved in cell wall biosynthesis